MAIMLRQTRNYIAVDPQTITINRPAGGPTSDGMGGRRYDVGVVQLPPQVCRIIPSRSRSSNQIQVSSVGQITVTRDMTLVALPGFDCQTEDWFMWEGQAYQISYVYSDQRWQVQAQLDLMGETVRSTI